MSIARRKQVTATLLGGGQSRAVYRDGLGCYVDNGGEAADAVAAAGAGEPQRALLPEIAGAAVVEPANPDLKRALDRAFAEPEQPPFRHTKAVVVVKDGHIIAERYAPGYGVDTPILGYSATKSVTSALTGILVRQGKLAARSNRRRWRPGKTPAIPAMPSRSTIYCATPADWRWAVRSTPRLRAPWRPSTG